MAEQAAANGQGRPLAEVSSRSSRRPAFPLVLIWLLLVPLALAMRLPPVHDSLWLDELHTSWTVQGPWNEVALRAAEGNQTPVYFWGVWWIVRCLGESEWTLRLLSLVAGVTLVPAVALLGFLWTRSAILATLAACLVVFDPHCVYFAREARPYALAQLLVVVHFMAFTGRLAGQRGSRLAWNLTLWLAFFTHCTTVLVVAAELVVISFSRWRRSWRTPVTRRSWLQDLGLGILVGGCAVPYLSQLAARRTNWEAFVPVPELAALGRLFAWIPYVFVPVLCAACVSVFIPRWLLTPRREAAGPGADNHFLQRLAVGRWLRWDWPLACILAWYIVPAVLAWTSTRLGIAAIFFRRYLMTTAVAWFLFAAWCGLRLRPRGPRLLFSVLVLAAVAATHGQWVDFYYGRHSGEAWRSAVGWVRETDATGRTLLWLRPGLIEDRAAEDAALRDYLQFPVRGLYRVTQPVDRVEVLARDWNGWNDRQWQRLREEPRGLLLARGTLESRQSLLARCEAAARERGGRWETSEVREFPGVTVVRFQVTCPAPTERNPASESLAE